MGDSGQGVDRAVAGADFVEWNFSIMAGGSPWRIEQGMTQLLAHQGAEGFGPSLAVAAREDALVIHELGRRETPTAVAALRAFQAMSPVDTQRELARLHAERLVRQGVPDPSWASRIGRVRMEGCWWAHDLFDETAFVLCAFSYGGADEHGILALIDLAIGGGLFRELTLGTDVEVLRDVLRRADGLDGLVTEPLDPAYARRLFVDAVATSDEVLEDREYQPKPVPVAYRKMRALTLARARALSAVAAPPEPLPDSVEVELMKRAFLASAAASKLPAGDMTSRAVDLLVAQFTDRAACHPLRLGPRQVAAAVGLPDLAPDAVDDADVSRILPDVARAWVCWTAAERSLSRDATERLEQAAEQACARLRPAGTDGHQTT
ncbi:hypothetical protein KIF24_10205 [Micromonospora sp. Llam7]|uniref:hypothetical protein n=1 Tax=Micromonospora tarapacensis TaxID=2835305 RepID=UPI001C83191F|nr:hypothetical protein [Micromonospora tarapacensis]MBX7266361.1 hypothetical protein [Micromonospora tarapacensis]